MKLCSLLFPWDPSAGFFCFQGLTTFFIKIHLVHYFTGLNTAALSNYFLYHQCAEKIRFLTLVSEQWVDT